MRTGKIKFKGTLLVMFVTIFITLGIIYAQGPSKKPSSQTPPAKRVA